MTSLSEKQTEAIDILARTLYGEGRGESFEGREAIAAVVLNRVAYARVRGGYWWGSDIRDVCLKPWQFSCWNKNDPNLSVIQTVSRKSQRFRDCLETATQALAGRLQDQTSGATHYHHRDLRPVWSQGATKTCEIGAHLFYKDIA